MTLSHRAYIPLDTGLPSCPPLRRYYGPMDSPRARAEVQEPSGCDYAHYCIRPEKCRTQTNPAHEIQELYSASFPGAPRSSGRGKCWHNTISRYIDAFSFGITQATRMAQLEGIASSGDLMELIVNPIVAARPLIASEAPAIMPKEYHGGSYPGMSFDLGYTVFCDRSSP